MTQNNPLKKFHRIDKISIELPSGNNYKNKIETNVAGLIGIKAMTGGDEMELRNPDSLMSGAAIENVIRSCVNIKDVKNIYTFDIDALMLGIKSATYGDDLSFNVSCSECKEDGEFSRSIEDLLSTANKMSTHSIIELPMGIEVHLHPSTYENTTNANILAFSYAKSEQIIKNDDIDDMEKLKELGPLFRELEAYEVDQVVKNVASVFGKDDNDDQFEVTNKSHIKEFIIELDSVSIKKIKDEITALDKTPFSTSYDVECSHCGHTWVEENLTYNPVDFFE